MGNPFSLPTTMWQPPRRRLFCVYSDNPKKGIAIDCTPNQDYISDVQEKIWEKDRVIRESLSCPGDIKLCSLKVPLGNGLTEDNLVPLAFHERISFDFPRSGDHIVQIVIMQPDEPKGLLPAYNPITTCRRGATVSQLAQILDQYQFIHVRGTPSSGKTRLAKLLQEHYHRGGERALYKSTWKFLDERTVWKAFAEHFGCPEEEVEGTVFLLDEAQSSYEDEVFWNTVIKEAYEHEREVRICLFASYGSPSTGMPHSPGKLTPAWIPFAQRVSIMPIHEEDSPNFGVFYNRDEFDDALTKLSTNLPGNFTFEDGAKDYIFHMTNGHPGGVKSITKYIHQVYKSDITTGLYNKISKDRLLRALKDEIPAMKSMMNYSVGRSVPRNDSRKLTPEARDTLKRVLKEGSIEFIIEDDGIKTCYVMGWVHRINQQGQDLCVMPSPLHSKYIERMIGDMPPPFPNATFPSIQILCKAIIGQFSASNLRLSTEGKKITTAGMIRPVEAQYQDEFYRAFNFLLPGITLSSKWARAGNGRIDFWVAAKNWGIQLLRDHDRVDEHCDRFKKGGQYHRWVEEGLLQEWLIIDCATSPASNPHPEPRLWRAIFEKDYSSVRLFDNCNNPLTDLIALTNYSTV